MSDSDSPGADERVADPSAGEPTASDETDTESLSTEELRARVEAEYDFEDFGPADMAEMSAEEWEAAFDADTWITGEALLDRVEADLRSRVAQRDVFARVERFDDVLVAYDEGSYAAVYPDGSVEGMGTVLRDVQPTVALCSMESYEVPDPPEDSSLPAPDEVPEGGATLGNTVLQVIGGVQILAGLVLLGAFVLSLVGVFQAPAGGGINAAVILVAGLGFLGIGVFLFVTVANARLSDRYRAEEYRARLRAVGLEDGERPPFLAEVDGIEGDLPPVDSAADDGAADDGAADGGPSTEREP